MGMICSINAASESQLKSFKGDEDAFFNFVDEGEKGIDLDKAWHAIHFLLTGSAWEGDAPLNFIVVGGTPIEGTDSGYGEARSFTAGEVVAIHDSLASISDEDLMARFDTGKMKSEEIYPDMWEPEDDQSENKKYILEYFGILKEFVSKTATDKDGIVISIE